MFDNINSIISSIKQNRPLILNITNHVTMDFVANGLLSLGASPIMSMAPDEASDLIGISAAVVINTGTLDAPFVNFAKQVCQLANQFHKPIIFDPVGAGASQYRTLVCKDILDTFDISILRGNASEIMALAGVTQNTKGVDSLSQTHQAIEAAQNISMAHNTAVVISGPTDIIIDGTFIGTCDRGSPIMPVVTGTGCLFSAVVGAFHAVNPDRLAAAMAATLFYGVCGEQAARIAQKPGSFKTAFLDTLYTHPSRSDYDTN